MTLTVPKTRRMVELFAILGLPLGFYLASVFSEWIFYTTKPISFVNGWFITFLAFVAAASFATIPFGTHIAQQKPSPPIYFKTLICFLIIWTAIAFLTSAVVRVITAKVHYITLNIPDWLIPSSLLLVAILPGLTILVLGFFKSQKI